LSWENRTTKRAPSWQVTENDTKRTWPEQPCNVV